MIARKLFVEKGYDQTSINDILKIIEIAKGTFYYYFTSKEELLEEIIMQIILYECSGKMNERLYLTMRIEIFEERGSTMPEHRIFKMSFSRVYPLLVSKAERKGRTKAEVDEIIRWFTGYTQDALEKQIIEQVDYEHFLKEAPHLNPSRNLIKGVVCGIRVEEIEDPMMREVRYLDKLIDELAKGKAMNKILRANSHL